MRNHGRFFNLTDNDEIWVGSKGRVALRALGFCSIGSVGFWVARAFASGHTSYWYLVWNLFLAWLPLILAGLLYRSLSKSSWLTFPNILLSVSWLIFLPNSFYIVTDFIHLRTYSNQFLMLDIAMLSSFSVCGVMLGFASIVLLHLQLRRRLDLAKTTYILLGVMLASSFAIYLGRYLRWNTWDVLLSPGAILFDFSDRLLNPSSHTRTFSTTIIFFAFLCLFYFPVWEYLRVTRGKQR